MTSNCTPAGIAPVIDDPCAWLGKLRAALYALMAGQATYEVRDGERWLTYNVPTPRRCNTRSADWK